MDFSNSSLTSIEAGKPYIVKWDSGDHITIPVFKDVIISKTTSNVETEYADFIGNYDPVDFAGEDKSILYFDANNNLVNPNAAMTINAFRAYFKLKGIDAGHVAFGSGKPTGINVVES